MRVLYLIHGTKKESLDTFKARVCDFTQRHLLALADSVVLALTEKKPPLISIIPFRSDRVALVSLDGVAENTQWPQPPEGFQGAFIGEAAIPVEHKHTWPMGEKSPGMGFVTLFNRKKGLSDTVFLDRWFNSHTPLTLEVHPCVGYVRNRITGTVNAAGPVGQRWDGIVEEQYDPPTDLLNPVRFFGGSVLKMLPTMLRVYADIKKFIHLPGLKSWLTSEYRLK